MTSRGAEKMKNDTVGVDVSKDHLDAYRLADGASRPFRRRRREWAQGASQMAGRKAWGNASSSSRPAPSSRLRKRARGGRRPFRQGQSPSGASLRRGHWQARQDRSPGRGDARSHGRAFARTRGSARPCERASPRPGDRLGELARGLGEAMARERLTWRTGRRPPRAPWGRRDEGAGRLKDDAFPRPFGQPFEKRLAPHSVSLTKRRLAPSLSR